MSMIREFSIKCDAAFYCQGANDTDIFEYAEAAVNQAKQRLFHLRNYKAICPDCWDQGYRFENIVEVA